MRFVTTVPDLRSVITELRQGGRRIAFVPTMGNLHEGHLQLIRVARRQADCVVVSIFVNPLQFGPDEDFVSYPRTLDEDKRKLASLNVDLIFAPDETDFYPRKKEELTFVEVPGISDVLCGEKRPGHFRGVATVVNRLFNLVQPDVAVFGKKDYQQLLVIRLMTRDLGLPVEIVGVDTVREEDGLALSSRNRYLNHTERESAPVMHQVLRTMADEICQAGKVRDDVINNARSKLEQTGFDVDYISIRRPSDFTEAREGDKELVILIAACLGGTRLIDNIELSF
jgi:pantoate--beta-alanine ligase